MIEIIRNLDIVIPIQTVQSQIVPLLMLPTFRDLSIDFIQHVKVSFFVLQSGITPSRYKKDNSFGAATSSGDPSNSSWRPNAVRDRSHTTTPVSMGIKGNAASHTQLSRSWSRETTTTPCGRGADTSENESPVVARQRAAQRAKAWRLECYRTPVDNLSPLPSAIPVGVRKAFKSPLVTQVMSTPMKDSHHESNTTLKANPLVESTGNACGRTGNNSDAPPDGPCIETTVNMSANVGDPDTQNGSGSQYLIDEPCAKEGLSDDSCSEGSLQTGWGKKRKSETPPEPSEKPCPPGRRKSLRLQKRHSTN